MFLRRKKHSHTRRLKLLVLPERGYKRLVNYFVLRLKRLPGTPEFIARGFAVGIAINFWPILFTHLVGGYLLCVILDGSILAMVIGTLFGNPWTFAIVYPIMYKIGKIVLGLRPTHNTAMLDSADEVFSKIWPIQSWDSLFVALKEIILPMTVGGFLLALPCAIFSYYIVRNAIHLYHVQHRKHLKKAHEKEEADIITHEHKK